MGGYTGRVPVLHCGMELEALAAALADAEADDQRAVLRHLVCLAVGARPAEVPGEADPHSCPNCGKPAASARSPYCGDGCREEAAFVRQFRTALDAGSLAETDKQGRLGQALWHLLGGGYPHRLPLILPSTSKQALKRTDGRCEGCGVPASTFDHLGSG